MTFHIFVSQLRRLLRREWLVRTAVPLIVFVTIWQLLSNANAFSVKALPGPAAVAKDFLAWMADGQLIVDVLASLSRVAQGFSAGSVAATFIALAMEYLRICRWALEPLVEVLRPIPPLAWIPLSILWFGIGNGAAAFLVSLGTFFPVFTGIRRGLAAINPKSLETARLYELPLGRRIREIIIPQALPAIVSGIIVGMGVSWMIVITAELVGTQDGLGYAIQIARLQLHTDRVISGMLVIGIIGYAVTSAATELERRTLAWRNER